MDISLYCKQDAILKKTTIFSTCGVKITTVDMGIKIRFENKRKLIATSNGQNVVSAGLIFSTVLLTEDDQLVYEDKTYVILSSEPCIKLSGEVSHYESYCV